MKLSNRNTSLQILTDNDAIKFNINDNEQGTRTEDIIIKELAILRIHFRDRIRYLCNTFIRAYEKGIPKLTRVFTDEPIEESGTLIIPLEKSGNATVFYQVSAKPDRSGRWAGCCTIIHFFTDKNLKSPLLLSFVRRSPTEDFVYGDDAWSQGGKTAEEVMSTVITMLLFIKYCELETKVVLAGKKIMHVDEKYVNETDLAIEILDSTWFTTIIRSESFMVGAETGGFFKLQPCGEGLKDRKLIWINPYEKKGYIRKAKILGQEK